MIERWINSRLEQALKYQPATALLGPRQAGKTTLARAIAEKRPSLYLDLESPADLLKLSDPLEFLSRRSDRLIVLDEIQRKPDLFMVLRGLIDEGRRQGRKNGRFLILGSASGDLLRQSGESLAGRITYLELPAFNFLETGNLLEAAEKSLRRLWLRGGFPESFLAETPDLSFAWRRDFIRSYLERDIPQTGLRAPAEKTRRLWTMLAHCQGQTLNSSSLAAGLDLNSKTVRCYVDILTDLLLVRRLAPWHVNVKKRLVKAPRVYLRDSGLLHQLLGIHNEDQLLSHPIAGASWEGFALENMISVLPPGAAPYFYRTAAGAEIDLVISFPGGALWAVEIKKGLAPKISKGFYQACEDIQAGEKYAVYSGEDEFLGKGGLRFSGLSLMMKRIQAVAI